MHESNGTIWTPTLIWPLRHHMRQKWCFGQNVPNEGARELEPLAHGRGNHDQQLSPPGPAAAKTVPRLAPVLTPPKWRTRSTSSGSPRILTRWPLWRKWLNHILAPDLPPLISSCSLPCARSRMIRVLSREPIHVSILQFIVDEIPDDQRRILQSKWPYCNSLRVRPHMIRVLLIGAADVGAITTSAGSSSSLSL